MHLKQCLDALAKCHDLRNFIIKVIVDGPKPSDSIENIKESIQVASNHPIVEHLTCHDINKGLSHSIIEGVTKTLQHNSNIIVIEDDLIVNADFLKFLSWGLKEYSNVDKVASVQGFTLKSLIARRNPYFMKGADCWGWATWQDRWCDIELNAKILIEALRSRNLTKQFDCYGLYPYTKMLQDNLEGKNDSWAIRWHATNFLLDRYSLCPPKSLVINFGNDGSGTHSRQYWPRLTEHRFQEVNLHNWKLPTKLPPSRISNFLSLTSFFIPFLGKYLQHIKYAFRHRFYLIRTIVKKKYNKG